MSDPFFDGYYNRTKQEFEQAKEAYSLIHEHAGGAIERRFLSRFDLNDPRRSKATLQSITGIRDQLKRFEVRLVDVDKTIAFAALQRDHFITNIGLKSGKEAFNALSHDGPPADDPLQAAKQGMAALKRFREGLATASENMDTARRHANLQVGALRHAITTMLWGRAELISAFADTELPVTVIQALKALRDLSAERLASQVGEALIEVIKKDAPDIAAELLQVASLVRAYRSLSKAFGAHDIDTNPNAVEAAQRLWDAMEDERRALTAIHALAAKVAQNMPVS